MTRPTSRVSRVLVGGPLAPFTDSYRQELRARGYTTRSCVNELRQVARLSLWLERGGMRADELTREQIEEFLGWQRAANRYRSQMSRPGLLCLLEVLSSKGVATVQPSTPPSATDALLACFERYLLCERGLAPGTVVGYFGHVQRFLAELPEGELAGLSSAQESGADGPGGGGGGARPRGGRLVDAQRRATASRYPK